LIEDVNETKKHRNIKYLEIKSAGTAFVNNCFSTQDPNLYYFED